jgi:hypothetical protein
MHESPAHPTPERHRGTLLLGVAAAAAIGVLWTALSVPAHDGDERVFVDTAPLPPSVSLARLDEGVDWSSVEVAPDAAPAAVAAYER